MSFYFDPHDSIYSSAKTETRRVLETIAKRYMDGNPPQPPLCRAFYRDGIVRGRDYRYSVDFDKLFPHARIGELVYTWGKIWSQSGGALPFDVNCLSPVVIYCNGRQIFRSDIHQERDFDKRARVCLALEPGWNHVVLRFRKTACAFGGIFGTWLGKLPYYFLLPDPARDGQEGWLHTEPRAEPLARIPSREDTPESTGMRWLPEARWDAKQRAQGRLARMFGNKRGCTAVGWARARFTGAGGNSGYILKGRARHASLAVRIDGESVLTLAKPGAFETKVIVPDGTHDIFVHAHNTGANWSCELSILKDQTPLEFINPAGVAGTDERWLWLGPLRAGAIVDYKEITNLNKIHAGLDGEKIYWRLDLPGTWVRLYAEAELYGRWNYPLGVTLYGLMQSGRQLGLPEICQYATGHMQNCCDLFDYAMWDRTEYGGPTNVLNLLTSIDSLDDCGSAGSAMLEIARDGVLKNYRVIADFSANHICNRQARLPDGAFFRKEQMHVFDNNTMWADDLYMSVPFLCRYSRLTDKKHLDDAAGQFLKFKKRLYIPELRLMSHVFDFNRDAATRIPWGRGNGWVLFSLAELLMVLPEKHRLRPGLLEFFRVLSDGALARQDGAGMWHQVLTDHESYPETSCTAMFTYAFSCGARHGWYGDPGKYSKAARKGWRGITKLCVDRTGNVHGVCVGSGFSFQAEYYKNDLPWRTNDTHGIGIVLLAGVEIMRLEGFLKTNH
jgi:rhamnogalacturonyl hydrolase YesR